MAIYCLLVDAEQDRRRVPVRGSALSDLTIDAKAFWTGEIRKQTYHRATARKQFGGDIMTATGRVPVINAGTIGCISSNASSCLAIARPASMLAPVSCIVLSGGRP